jgi:NAD(P)-dependent dehydrogenase (short-subunit alcohol dehydrogenase family)
MPNAPLKDKVALVTGASRGLGLEIARRLARAGANVVLVARDTPALDEALVAVQRECERGQFVGACPADLAVPAEVDRAIDYCQDEFGPVDVLVNNAAVQGPLGPFETLDWDAWRQVFEVDFFAPVRLCRRVIPGMRQREWGKIINISGGGATGPRPDVTAYACAKTALVRLTETLAEELRDAKIDVNAVAPGAMNTRMLDETIAAEPGGARREYKAALERSRSGGGTPPDKAAELVAWLASPESDGITGRLISAVWDDWPKLGERREALSKSDVYTLRRIVPKDRGLDW